MLKKGSKNRKNVKKRPFYVRYLNNTFIFRLPVLGSEKFTKFDPLISVGIFNSSKKAKKNASFFNQFSSFSLSECEFRAKFRHVFFAFFEKIEFLVLKKIRHERIFRVFGTFFDHFFHFFKKAVFISSKYPSKTGVVFHLFNHFFVFLLQT